MAELSQAAVEAALAKIIDPHTGKDLVSTKAIKSIAVDGGSVEVKATLGYPAASIAEDFANEIRDKLEVLEGAETVTVEMGWEVVPHQVQKGLDPVKGVKNIIAVASGKGGVGKSTVSVNLALALVAEGATVGILDADIYGPSQPRMLGIKGQPGTVDGKNLEPMRAYEVQAMSVGFLVEEETPMIWRGPMVTQALEQLLNETNWHDVDYLVIDLPPGTGDTQLTLAQKVPVSGAVIVTTPQDIALLDARKGLKMFEKVEIPVLGVIENMSTHICSQCGHEEHIFGDGGGKRMAAEYEIDLLGELPLDMRIREQADSGKPTVVADPDGDLAQNYRTIARKVAAALSLRAKSYTAKFPKIVIENN